MTHDEIYGRLREIAPSIVFTATTQPDEDGVWDGDGPDPADDGMIMVEVIISARVIHKGEFGSGESYLSGHYIYPGDSPDDISGYLPQKLEEATADLINNLPDNSPFDKELNAVLIFLNQEMHSRYYDEQRNKLTKDAP
jgi:hypothetical protein